jgi:hypothetical protein
MQHTLDVCRWLYNRLLDERERAWEATGTSVRLCTLASLNAPAT